MALCDINVKKFSVILLALFLVAPPVISNVVYVRPNNSTSCPGQPCHTLIEYAADVTLLPSNTEAIFGIGDHLLNTTLRLENLTNITFNGNMAKILFYPLASIVVINVEDIKLNFLQCELYQYSNSRIFLDNAGSVEIASIIFRGMQYSRSDSMDTISSVNSSVKIINCSFHDIIGSIIDASSASVIDFSGNYFTNNSFPFQATVTILVSIAYSTVTFNDNIFYQNAFFFYTIGYVIYIRGSSVQFSGLTTFKDNPCSCIGIIYLSTAQVNGRAIFENNSVAIVIESSTHLELKGNVTFMLATVAIVLRGHALINCTGEVAFYNNNLAFRVFNSYLYFSGVTNFESNLVAINAYQSSQLELNGKVTFSNHNKQVIRLFDESSMNCFGEVTFSNNIITGSSVIYAHTSNLSFSGITKFDSNSALNANGGAVFINGSTLHTDGIISFESNTARKGLNINTNGGAIYSFDSDVTLKGSIDFLNNWAEEGFGGAIFSFSSTLQIEGDCRFANNNAKSRGGVIFVVDSDIQLSGDIQFQKNKAQSGGAIAFDNSTLTLLGPVTVDFIENEAEDAGGALFFLDQDSITLCDKKLSYFSTEECFFRLLNFNETDQNIQLNFWGNIAENGGTVLYGGSLDECTVDISGTSKKGFEAFEDISDTYPNNDNSSDITSNPKEMCFCINGTTPDCSLIYPEENITTVRGRQFNLSVVLVGQGNKPVASTLRAYIDNDDILTQLHPATHITSTICTDISFMMFSGNGSKTLVLYPDEGPCFSSNTAKKRVQIDFDNCPPGFTLDPKHNYTRCACEQRLIEVNETNKCDIEEEVIERPDGTWIKPTWDEDGNYIGFILSRYCPFNYCNEIQSLNFLFDDGNNVSDAQCDENRTGTLCGNCTENHSLTLNQFKCRECGNEYISLLVLFAFAGVLLIVILTGLHMTVAAGTINGLILYANIIGANSERFFSHKVNVFTVFISWLNLDFGFDYCLFDELDFYTYVWLQYAFPIYLWFLMGIIILSSRRSAVMMKLLGSNPIAVLATLILLSYTALLQNIIAALSFTRLEFANGTTTTVWLFNGNIAFMEGNHLILAITSLFISAFFFLPFTFFLMFGYYLLAFSNRRCFTWLNRFKPLLDAFYGPYQKEVRFWTGFMLLLRFCLYLTFALKRSRDDSTDLLAILTVFSIVISLAWLSRRGIYEKLYLDLLEASFILNIFLLTTVTYYYDTEGFSEQHQDTATYVSVGIAIAEFVGIVIFHITCRILKCPCAKHLRERVLKYNANGEENLPLRNNEFVHTREAVDNHDLQVDDQI